MDVITSVLILIFLTFKGNSELSLENTPCPSVCVCNGNTATCEGHGFRLRYIPPLPENTTSLVFSHHSLKVMAENVFNNISGLRLTRLELRSNRIATIGRMAFRMLPHLQYLDLSENGPRKLRWAFLGLENNTLKEIRLTKMNLGTLSKDFFKYLGNTSLERVFFDDNIINSDIGNVMSPLSSHLREISFKNNQISNVSFNVVMPKMEVLILSNNKLLSIPNFCHFHTLRRIIWIPNLKVLDLSDNLITVVKGGKFFRQCLPRIQNLSLGYNKIKTLGKDFISRLPFLVNLSIENLDSNFVPHENFLNSSSLQYLYMGDKSKDLKYNRYLFNYTRSLKILDMSGLKFVLSPKKMGKQLFQLFKPLTRLEELVLKRTSLSKFPATLFQLMPNLTKLSLQDCYFNETSLKKLFAVASLKVLLLDNNLITSINETNIPIKIEQMSLKGNPFLCNCDLVFFRKWIESNSERLLGWPDDYTCNLPQEWKGKSLVEFHLNHFFCHPINPYIIMAISISFAVLIIATASCTIYRKRWHIKYYLYLLRAKKRGYEVLGGDDFAYDVFVAYNSVDRVWVISEMIPRLEIRENLKFCLHDRDFQVGKLIVDNITDAMHKSRKILIILSNSFAQSHWCRFETMMAQLRSVNHGENTVVIVVLENILTKNMNNSLHLLLKSTTFIEWTNEKTAKEMFWDRLVSSLKP